MAASGVQVSRGPSGELAVVVPAQRSAGGVVMGLGATLATGLAVVGYQLSSSGVSPTGLYVAAAATLCGLGLLGWYIASYELRYHLDAAKGSLSVLRRGLRTAAWELPLAEIQAVKVDTFKGGQWFLFLMRDGRELRFGDGTGQPGYAAAAEQMNAVLSEGYRSQP